MVSVNLDDLVTTAYLAAHKFVSSARIKLGAQRPREYALVFFNPYGPDIKKLLYGDELEGLDWEKYQSFKRGIAGMYLAVHGKWSDMDGHDADIVLLEHADHQSFRQSQDNRYGPVNQKDEDYQDVTSKLGEEAQMLLTNLESRQSFVYTTHNLFFTIPLIGFDAVKRPRLPWAKEIYFMGVDDGDMAKVAGVIAHDPLNFQGEKKIFVVEDCYMPLSGTHDMETLKTRFAEQNVKMEPVHSRQALQTIKAFYKN